MDLLGITLSTLGGIGFYLSLREAFAYRILVAMGKETPLPFLYFIYNQAFMPALTMLLLIAGGGICQRREWSRKLIFALAVTAFFFFVLLNIEALIRVTKGQPHVSAAIPVKLYLFIYLIWGYLIWFFRKEPVRLQFAVFEESQEDDKSPLSYGPLPGKGAE